MDSPTLLNVPLDFGGGGVNPLPATDHDGKGGSHAGCGAGGSRGDTAKGGRGARDEVGAQHQKGRHADTAGSRGGRRTEDASGKGTAQGEDDDATRKVKEFLVSCWGVTRTRD